jgi:hypothetical protein
LKEINITKELNSLKQMKRTLLLLLFGLLVSLAHYTAWGQDTTVTWLRNIDTTTFKMLYNKRAIPKEVYQVIGMANKNDIANPADNWTPSCMASPHRGLNWIAKDKKNHLVISVTYGAKAVVTKYYYFDKEKGKLNVNELTFERKRLTFVQTTRLIKTRDFEFEEIDLAEYEKEK